MSDTVSLGSIKRSIFEIRAEIAEIHNEQPSKEGVFDSYMWKGIKITSHRTKKFTRLVIISAESYKDVPENRYVLLLIRDDMLKEKQYLTMNLINKVMKYGKSSKKDQCNTDK